MSTSLIWLRSSIIDKRNTGEIHTQGWRSKRFALAIAAIYEFVS